MMEIDVLNRIDNGMADAARLQLGESGRNGAGPLLHRRMGHKPCLCGVCRASTFTRLESCIGVSG